MKVLYNAIPLAPPLTGVGVYSKHISEEMALIDDVEEVEYFLGGECGDLETLLRPVLASKKILPLRKKIQHALLLRYSTREILNGIYHYLPALNGPITAAIEQLENRQRQQFTDGYLYHETNFVLKRHDGPKVVTVHDLGIHRYPEYHPKERVDFMTKGMKRSLKEADQIITVSDFVKTELIEHYDLDSDIVTAVPNAVADVYQPRSEDECADCLQKYGLDYRCYLVVIGSVEPRKNLSLLMDAYGDLPEEMKSRFPLIHIGPAGWNNTEIQIKAKKLESSGWFKSLGYVDQSDLPYLLSGAVGLTFPSIYEGFGLPALEAMASGVPVLSSHASALPEVVGTGGILIDPYSRHEITTGIYRILDRGKSIEDMIATALTRAESFSWARTARETYDVYLKAHH